MKFISQSRTRPFIQKPTSSRPSSFGWQPLQYSLIYEKSVPIRSYEISQQVYDNESTILEWRRRKMAPIVQVLSIKSEPIKSHGNSTLTILTEHIAVPLDQINNISLPQAVYLLREMTLAYRAIFYRLGYANISQRCCGLNHQGEFLAWINENLALNRVTEIVLASEAAVVKKINQIVYYKCSDRDHPFFNEILNVQSKFDETMAFIVYSTKKYNIHIPRALFTQDRSRISGNLGSQSSPAIQKTVVQKNDAKTNKCEPNAVPFRQSSHSKLNGIGDSYMKSYDMVYSPKYVFNHDTQAKIQFSYSESRQKEGKFSSEKTIPRSIRQFRSHSPSYKTIRNGIDQIKIEEFGVVKANQESNVSISSRIKLEPVVNIPRKAFAPAIISSSSIIISPSMIPPKALTPLIVLPPLSKLQIKKSKNTLSSNEYNFYFEPSQKIISLTKRSMNLKTYSPIYQSMTKNVKANIKRSTDEVYSNKSSISTHHKDSKLHSTNTSLLSNNAEGSQKNTSFLANFNTIPCQNSYSYIEKEGRGSQYNFGGLFPAVDKIQEESKEVDLITKNQITCQSMEVDPEQKGLFSFKNLEQLTSPNYASDNAITKDMNQHSFVVGKVIGQAKSTNDLPIHHYQHQWKNQIKQLLIHNDDNLKQSVYCGPQIRAEPVKLEMLHHFGRDIQGSMMPEGDYSY